MDEFAEDLERELESAVEVKDKTSLHRYIRLLVDGTVGRRIYESGLSELQGDVRVIGDRMEKGFKLMEERFTAMDRRFESMQIQMDRRFESMQIQMDQRFEQVDKRFDDMNSRFRMMFTFVTVGFTVLAILMTLFKLLQ